MRKWAKRILWTISGVAAVLVISGLIWREELTRLNGVLTLFDEDKIVHNFSHMGDAFLSTPVKRGGEVFTFGSSARALPDSFTGVDGETRTEEYLEKTKTTSLLVVRDDQIEFEDYYLGTGPEDLRISWSIAKSFLSTLVGVAVGDGDIESLDDPVLKYAPSLAGSAYEGSTLRDVANMASGVEFDEDYLAFNSDINKMGRELALGGSLDEFAGRVDGKIAGPGEAWKYVSIDTHVLGMALRGATGSSVADYMSQKLWSRIGAEADAYYLTDGHGAAFVLGGLNIRTRDYAKLGRLFLNDGVWEGERILPPGWARESTAQSAPPPYDADHPLGYGYQWWLPPDADDEFFGVGVYGQYLWVDRRAGVIIVKTSADRAFRANNSQSRLDHIAMFRAISRR